MKKRSQYILENLTEKDIPRLPRMMLTKRILLGMVNSQYDPMVLICPLLMIWKIDLRDLFWSNYGLGWDNPVSKEIHEKWVEILFMFLGIGDIINDRLVCPEGYEDPPELIAFADGSLAAYACCVYIRSRKLKEWPTHQDRYYVKLICGKARVTSVRGTTATRKEVSGAVS